MKKLVFVLLAICIVSAKVVASGQSGATSGTPVEFEWTWIFQISDDERALVRKAEEALNVKVNYVINPVESNPTIISTRMAAGDLPEIFMADFDQQYRDAVTGRLATNVTKMAEDLELTNLQNQIQEVERRFGKLFAEKNGEYYRLPILRPPGDWYFIYRKDWADKLGVKYDGTLKGFVKFAEALGNYNDEAVGFSALGWWYPGTAFSMPFCGIIAPSYNKPNLRQNAKGKWFSVETTDDYREMIKFLTDLYKRGILDPEIFSITRDQGVKKFTTGKVGVLGASVGWENDILTALKKNFPEAEIAAFEHAPLGPKGYARPANRGYFHYWVFGNKHPERTAAAARFLNLMHSDEYVSMMTRPEGWKMVSGNISRHTWTYFTSSHFDYSKMPDFVRVGLMNAAAEQQIQDPRSLEYSTEISLRYKAEVVSVLDEYMAKFVTGVLDINSNTAWKDYLEQCDKAGLPKLIEDIAHYFE